MKFSTLLLLPLILMLAACGPAGNNTSSNPQVEQKIAIVLEAMKQGNFDQALDQYDESFFKLQGRDAWRAHLQELLAERGPIQAFHLRRSQADTRLSGKFYLYEYETVHDGNKRLHHLFTLVWPVDRDEFQLVGHKLTPWEAEG